MNKEVSKKGIGGHFGEISAINLIDQTVIRSHRFPPTESQMDLVHVTQQIDRCLSFKLQSDDKPTGRIVYKRKSLLDTLRIIFAKRVRYSFQLLRQFVVYGESSLSIIANDRVQDALDEASSSLQSVLSSHDQKLKVYAFIRIKMLAANCDYTFSQPSFIDREYLLLKLQALEASTQRIFESLRKTALMQFFVQIQRFAEEQALKEKERKANRQRQFHSETLRKTSKSATMIGPSSATTDNTGKQIIYVIQNDGGRGRQKTEHGRLSSIHQPAFIKVPLYGEQVELNQIRLNHDKTEKPSRFNVSTAHKQRRRMVEYDVTKLAKHGTGQCTECKFCRQQLELKEIERTSQERRKSLTAIKSQFSKNRRLVYLN